MTNPLISTLPLVLICSPFFLGQFLFIMGPPILPYLLSFDEDNILVVDVGYIYFSMGTFSELMYSS